MAEEPPEAVPRPRLVVPVPASATVCGLLEAPSAMVRVAFREPAAAGVKMMAILQFAPATTLLPQVLVSPKSLLSDPVAFIPLMVKAVLPVLVRVTVWDELATFTT